MLKTRFFQPWFCALMISRLVEWLLVWAWEPSRMTSIDEMAVTAGSVASPVHMARTTTVINIAIEMSASDELISNQIHSFVFAQLLFITQRLNWTGTRRNNVPLLFSSFHHFLTIQLFFLSKIRCRQMRFLSSNYIKMRLRRKEGKGWERSPTSFFTI